MTDWLRSLHRFFINIKNRFSVRVSFYFFFISEHYPTLYTCHRLTHTKFKPAQFLLFIIHQGNAIKCYQSANEDDPKGTLKDCPEGFDLCGTVKCLEGPLQGKIGKVCYLKAAGPDHGCADVPGLPGSCTKANMCVCDTDGCNGDGQ